MSLSVTLDPTIALPAKQVRLIVSGNTGSAVTAKIVTAPSQSKFYSATGQPTDIDVRLDVAGRVGVPTICFVPDVGGVFSIDISDITQSRTLSGSGRRNSFQGAADGYAESQTLQTLRYSLKVAERMTTQVGAAGDYATLVLYVVDETILATTEAEHAEKTPALVSSTSERARVASVSSTVQTKLAALANITVSDSLGSIPEILAELAIVASEHYTAPTHQLVDEDGSVELQRYRGAVPSASGIISEANRIRSLLVRHLQNDSSAGSGAGLYHSDIDGYGYPDLKNLPIAGSAVDAQSARILIADLHRSYEAHRAQVSSPQSHLSVDMANMLTALPAMLALDSAFLSVLASNQPTTPTESNAGVVMLVFGAGFKRANP